MGFKSYLYENKEKILKLAKEKALKQIKDTLRYREDLATLNFNNYNEKAINFLDKAVNDFISNTDTKTLNEHLGENKEEKRKELIFRARKSIDTIEFKTEIREEIKKAVLNLEKKTTKMIITEKEKRKRTEEKKKYIENYMILLIEELKNDFLSYIKNHLAIYFLDGEKIENNRKRNFYFYEFNIVADFYQERRDYGTYKKAVNEHLERMLIHRLLIRGTNKLIDSKGKRYFEELSEKGETLPTTIRFIVEENINIRNKITEIIDEVGKENFQVFLQNAFGENPKLDERWKKVRIKRITKHT